MPNITAYDWVDNACIDIRILLVILIGLLFLPIPPLYLAGVGHRKLAWRLTRTFFSGIIVGGVIGVLAGELLFWGGALFIKFVDAAGEFILLFYVFGFFLACIVVLVATAIATYKHLWLHRKEFRREGMSIPYLLLLFAACVCIGEALLWILGI